MSWSGAPSHRQSPPFRSLIFYSLERTEFFAISSWKIAGKILAYDRSTPQTAICFQWMRSMIDAVLNIAVFAALVLCIVGFGAWAHKRVS